MPSEDELPELANDQTSSDGGSASCSEDGMPGLAEGSSSHGVPSDDDEGSFSDDLPSLGNCPS